MWPHKKKPEMFRSSKHGHHVRPSNRGITSSENNAWNTAKEDRTVFLVTKTLTLSVTNSREQ